MAVIIRKESPATGAWATGTNWEGDTAPVSTDTAIISKGSVDLDGSDVTAVKLAAVYVTPGFTGKIGDSVNYLQLDTEIAYLESGGDEVWLSLENAIGGDVRVDVGDSSATLATGTTLATKGVHLKTGSTEAIDPLHVRGGDVKVEDSTLLTEVVVHGGNCTVGASLSGFTTARVKGGTLICETGPSATFEVVSGIGTNSDNTTCTDVDLRSGVLNWYGGATITTLECWAGTFDATGATEQWVVTNQLLIDNAAVDLRAGIAAPTLSAGWKIEGNGSIQFDRGAGYPDGPTYQT